METVANRSYEEKDFSTNSTDQKPEALEAVTFDDLETVEEIVTGAVSGLVGCCIF